MLSIISTKNSGHTERCDLKYTHNVHRPLSDSKSWLCPTSVLSSLWSYSKCVTRWCDPSSEAEFLDVIGTKILRLFHHAIQSPLLADFTPQLWFSWTWIFTALTWDLEWRKNLIENHAPLWFQKSIQNNHFMKKAKSEGRNLKSEKSPDYARKSQRNCTFMN